VDQAKLTHFLAVAEHRHFGRAAEALGLSQQALSKSVATLERGLRVRLFDRGQFGAVLTPYGEALQRRARIIDAELRLGQAEIESLRGSRQGSIRVGVGPSLVGRVMPEALLRMHEARPGVQMSTYVESSAVLYPMLLRGEVELVVSAPSADVFVDSELRCERLFLDRDVLVVRADHPLAKRRRVTLADLQNCIWISSAQVGSVWLRVCREFTAVGLSPPTRVLRADATALGKELLLRGDCVVLASRENVHRELAAQQFVELNVPRLGEVRVAQVATRSRSTLQPAAAELVEHVRQVAFELHGRPA
jgi:DNA-binding transcriptional LysR family regulator